MDHDFWHERWQTRQLGFHLAEVNPLLVKHHAVLPAGGRVLVPLCGKSLDLEFLAAEGQAVVGVELVQQAVDEFFAERSLAPVVAAGERAVAHSMDGLTLLTADLFGLARGDVGAVTSVWDRAALVAMPPELRPRYARALCELAPGATMLLVTFRHDFGGGPPFSVSDDEVRALYDGADVALIDAQPGVPSPSMQAKGMKGLEERVWRIVLP